MERCRLVSRGAIHFLLSYSSGNAMVSGRRRFA